MENASANRIEELLRSVFPEGAIERIQVLTYGDDPEVEPGETGIRVFISRAGRPESEEADKEIIQAFEEANHAVLKQLRDKLPGFIGWIHFQPDTAGGPPRAGGPILFIKLRGRESMAPDELTEQLTPVNTRLGHRPHPRKPGLRPAPGQGARDQRPQDQVLTRPGVRPVASDSCF